MGNSHLNAGMYLHGGMYRIVRFINSGGFGCTYEAEHVMLEKKMAIKEFFVHDFCNRDRNTAHVTVGTESKRGLVDKLRRKFVEEAKAIGRLEHPGIVRVSDVFEENGTAYYVMDYIKGSSLSDIVKGKGCLSESEALRYIRQVADALRYVHSHNRLHLDVKPGNIMVDGKGNAILIDFGASKQYDEVNGENTSTLMGKTPGFAPPEQMGNDVVKFTPATDIYALGATLYKLLTGTTPPSSNLRSSGEKLAPLPENINEGFKNAVNASLRLNKTERPQSVDEFLAILDGTESVLDEAVVVETDEGTKIDDKTAKKVDVVTDEIANAEAVNSEDVEVKTVKAENVKLKADKRLDEVNLTDQEGNKKSSLAVIAIALACAAVVVLIVYFVTPKLHSGNTNVFASTDTLENVEPAPQLVQEIGSTKEDVTQSTEDVLENLSNVVEAENEDNGQNNITVISVNDNPNQTQASQQNIQQTQIGSSSSQQTQINSTGSQQTQPSSTSSQQIQNQSQTQISNASGKINGYEYVDLGLSVKWARYNIGTSSPSGYGNYYAWGEIKTKNEYTVKNHISLKKISNIAGNSKYDAARANWGGSWRLPTKAEIDELMNKCKKEWTTVGNVKGYKVTGPNGNSIFLPVAGFRRGSSSDGHGDGSYWSSTFYESGTGSAYGLYFYSGNFKRNWSLQYYGQSVRPVSE
ncbi:MAG: protein kinase [Prevotella sp.]|nr:protein kinase [Prevotella sp.]